MKLNNKNLSKNEDQWRWTVLGADRNSFGKQRETNQSKPLPIFIIIQLD